MSESHPFDAEGQSQPKLSICIVTYNRAAYLDRTLRQLVAASLPFSCEIIVNDNCSTDDTSAVMARLLAEYPFIRYFRQTHNVGASANLQAAYRHARGEYCVYLADDDQLIPEGLTDVIAYMDRHPAVGVCHCPWEAWDDVTRQAHGLFYQVAQEVVFSRKDALSLCDFIINGHIFPEICVFRTDLVQKIMYLPQKAYWAFVHLINALGESDIAFLPFPFYRFVARHWEGETRQQLGNQQAMSEWDLYRGGIEYMLHKAFAYAGFNGIPQDRLDVAQKAVQVFVNARMQVALRLLVETREFSSAFDVFVRLLANHALSHEEADSYRQLLVGRAAVQAVVATLQAMTNMEVLGLYQVESPDAVKMLIAESNSDIRVETLPAIDSSSVAGNDRMLVLAGHDQARQQLVNAGFHPGFIIVEHELVRQFMA